MGFFEVLAYGKLGHTIAVIEKDMAEISYQIEIEQNSIGHVSELTIDKFKNVQTRIQKDVIQLRDKYNWEDDKPFAIAKGSFGKEMTTLGVVISTLLEKNDIIVDLIESTY